MVRHTLKILQQMLQDFWSVFNIFEKLSISELTESIRKLPPLSFSILFKATQMQSLEIWKTF